VQYSNKGIIPLITPDHFVVGLNYQDGKVTNYPSRNRIKKFQFKKYLHLVNYSAAIGASIMSCKPWIDTCRVEKMSASKYFPLVGCSESFSTN
jgi:hypothetical protein